MLFSKRILVILDERPASRQALVRARLIAEQTGAALELIWNSEYAPWQGYEAELTELDNSGCRWQRQYDPSPLVKLVRQHWQRDHFGLLVKSCDARHTGPSLLAPTDWRLLRETPCPVLLVKNQRRWAEGPVLAAVNPLGRKTSSQQHDQAVLMLATTIASRVQTPLHTVTATAMAMMGAEPELQSQALIDAAAEVALARQLARWQLQPAHSHVGEGPPEHWIPAVANQINASLVVIGTHARGGLRGALMGNTAEQILDRLDTDIMVLRPGLSDSLAPLLAG